METDEDLGQSSSRISCLTIIVDCDARHWGELVKKKDDDKVIRDLIDALASYATAHMSIAIANRVIVIAADQATPELTIYASHTSTEIDMSKAIRVAVRDSLKKSASLSTATDSPVFAPAITVAICHICRFKNEYGGGEGRIFIVNIGSDLLGEHNILMNIFFAAHKHNILIDVANLGESTAILQQASDITGGTYFCLEKPQQLLSYAMCFAFSGSKMRSIFPSKPSKSIDYRASCRCHGTPVSIGWVCSVCLSVQCHFTPICPCCNTVFKISSLARRGRKKRRE